MTKESDTDEKTMLELTKIYPKYRKVRDQYYKQFCSKIGRFVKFCENLELKPSDITPAHQQAFINELNQCGLAPETVRGYHRSIVAAMNFSEELKIGKVYLPKVPEKDNECLTIKEIKKLLRAAARITGKMKNGVPWSLFWETAIHVAYSTGLRRGDMLKVKSSKIDKKRYMIIKQSKTEKPVRVRFSKKAVKLIKKHGHKLATPWPYTAEHFGKCFKKLCKLAGVNPNALWKWLRRSAGSYADADGRGHEVLGNGRNVFEKHYRSQKVASKKLPKQVAIA